jgi:aquaporin Z
MGDRWRRCLCEAWGLGTFMLLACLGAVVLEHPASPLHRAIPSAAVRRALMGLAMGLVAYGIFESPWGRASGAHINPGVTLALLRLGKIAPRDVPGYLVAQVLGGIAGVGAARLLAGPSLADPAVNYAVTIPGAFGAIGALLAEAAMAFTLLTTVLHLDARGRSGRQVHAVAACLVGLFIFTLGPISGMGINPARTLASAVYARTWTGFGVYFAAPPLAMLAAAERFRRRRA